MSRCSQQVQVAGQRLPLGLQRVVQHTRSADFLGAQPEFLPDQLFAVGQYESQSGSVASEVNDLPRFAPSSGGKQNTLEAEWPVGKVGQMLLNDTLPVLQLRGRFALHVIEAKLQRAMDAEVISSHVKIEAHRLRSAVRVGH